jgi:hypothetical protein
MHKDICDGIEFVQYLSFLAGRDHFIDNELPKLLELAREMVPDEVCDIEVFTHTIEEIIAMVKK